MHDKVCLFHPGTQHSYHTAEALQEEGRLGLFCTGLYYKQSSTNITYKILISLLKRIAQEKLNERFSSGICEEFVHSSPLIESLFLVPATCNFPKYVVEHALKLRNSLFARRSARLALNSQMRIIWGFDTGSLYAFLRLKDRGGFCVLDQSVANVKIWETELPIEATLFPEWKDVEQSSFPAWRADIAYKERLLADRVLVGSDFCKQTFSDEPNFDSKFVIIPYGADLSKFNNLGRRRHDGPLRILFVGNTGLRKGLPYLFEALDDLRIDFTLRIIGQVKVPQIQKKRLGCKMEVLGHIPQTLLPAHYRWADVFAFPSLFEGAPIVLAEAMACGAVPITTKVGNWIVRDGIDGFVLPMRDAKSIRERLEMLAADRRGLARLSIEAGIRATQFSWNAYRARISSFLKKCLTGGAY
jgi:glycosyltransferase involved in cell wall biosynthesis